MQVAFFLATGVNGGGESDLGGIDYEVIIVDNGAIKNIESQVNLAIPTVKIKSAITTKLTRIVFRLVITAVFFSHMTK